MYIQIDYMISLNSMEVSSTENTIFYFISFFSGRMRDKSIPSGMTIYSRATHNVLQKRARHLMFVSSVI